MLCYVMLCYVMLCYVMLCYVMLCYVSLLISNHENKTVHITFNGVDYNLHVLPYVQIPVKAGITQLRHDDGRSSVIGDVSGDQPMVLITLGEGRNLFSWRGMSDLCLPYYPVLRK